MEQQQRPLQQQPALHQLPQQQGGPVYVTVPGAQMYPVPQVPMAGYVTISPQQQSFVQPLTARCLVLLGAALVIIGALAIIFNIVAIAIGDYFAIIGHGIWCGVLFIVTGGFGIGTRNKNRCMIVTFMVLCIISAAFTAALLGMGVTEAIANANCRSYHFCSAAGPAMGAILAALAFLAAAASIWGSVIGCCAVCGCVSPVDSSMMAQYSQQQVMLISPQFTQPGVQYAPAQMVMPQVQPAVSDPPGHYQSLLPQQQTWIPPVQQPLQPGGSQLNAYQSA